jgi:hypothetical protein
MSAPNEYDKGDTAVLSLEARVAGVLTDPSGLTFKLQDPDGITTTYVAGTDSALVHDSTGKYHVVATLSKTGRWFYRFTATGTVQGAKEQDLLVLPSVF